MINDALPAPDHKHIAKRLTTSTLIIQAFDMYQDHDLPSDVKQWMRTAKAHINGLGKELVSLIDEASWADEWDEIVPNYIQRHSQD